MTCKRVRLGELAFARSGDKGNNANIALFAYNETGYSLLKETVTEEAVLAFFKDLRLKSVKRYPVPNLEALNFVLIDALGGGGMSSLRIDSQGKSLGQALLEMEISVSKEIFRRCRGGVHDSKN